MGTGVYYGPVYNSYCMLVACKAFSLPFVVYQALDTFPVPFACLGHYLDFLLR
ncbi:hypothetical protein BDW60DRAFT_198959, partial [Aspergillus nidulans var. acristatus]